MTKLLSLMRHATAKNAGPGAQDLDRMLSEHGQKEAAQAGEHLRQYKIDKSIISFAKRTLQTFELTSRNFKKTRSEIVTDLYQNDNPDVIYDLLNAQKSSEKHILIIGHNPLIYEVAFMLANPNSKHHEFLISTMMPPARVITMKFADIDDWQNIAPGGGEILDVFTAKNL